jgi:MFS family permease
VLAALANALLNLAAFLFVHLPGFLQQLGAGEAQIGRIMAGQSIGAIVAWPFLGRAMDVRGRRIVILAGVALFVAVAGLYLSIGTLGPYIYAVRILDGAATMMWYTALFTYAADLVPPQRRTEGLALFGVSGLIALGLGAGAGDVVLAGATYRELFLLSLVLAALGLLLCLPLRDSPGHADARTPPRHVLITAAERNLLSVWVAALSFFCGVAALFAFMKTFALATGAAPVGAFFGAYAGVAGTLRIVAGWLPDRLGSRRMLGIAMSVYAAGFFVLASPASGTSIVVAGLLCGAGHGYAFPVLFSLVIERARPQERGAAAAFFTALDWIALLAAGPIAGYLIEQAGYSATFLGLGLLVATGMGVFYLLDRRSIGC